MDTTHVHSAKSIQSEFYTKVSRKHLEAISSDTMLTDRQQ